MEEAERIAFQNWLLDPKSNDDEYEVAPDPTDEILGAISEIIINWDDRAQSMTPRHQDKVLWRIIGNPLFVLQIGSTPSTDAAQLFLRAAKNVTLAIPVLFAKGEPIETSYFMWWDCLAGRQTNPEITDLCLEILCDLSRHEDERVLYAALHGLGHLNHPRRAAVVEDFMRRAPEAASDPWVLACRDGTVM